MYKHVNKRDTDISARHASQEQTLGEKKRPSIVNPLGMLFNILGTIKAKNKKKSAWKYSTCSLIIAKIMHF